MRLIPYDKNKLRGYYKRTTNQQILKEFADSGLSCTKLEGFTQANAYIRAAALRRSAIKFGMLNIQVIARKGEVYLIREFEK